jgi:arylsulfatase A-like enzyme
MYRKSLHWPLLLSIAATLVASSAMAAEQSARPNIVVVLADDLGWSDLGCYGADLHESPHLDRLAADGIRFTSAYAASSVCTPTRAALMTGKHPARLGMTVWAEAAVDPPKNAKKKLLPPPAEHNLSHDETTIAAHLQLAGYMTALVGKWHLGDAQHYPETHGFDVNIGGTLWGAPQTFFYPYRGRGRFGKEFRYVPHLEFGKEGEYLTDRLTDEALAVIDRAGDKPFFLYLAHHAPHTPIEAKPADVADFEPRVSAEMRHRNATYAAMVRSLDESVGRIRQRLDERGLAERTLFIFTSDNGGYTGKDNARGIPVTNNAPLRSGKGALYEGGIRVPLLIDGPGNSAVCSGSDEPVVTTDLFFTILSAAGLTPPEGVPQDGISLTPLLTDPGRKLGREALYFHYPHYYETTSPVSAVRAGDWKLLEYFEDQHVELYNLKDDLSEQHDLAQDQPELAERLRRQLHEWRASIGAREPATNPDFKK